MKYYYIIVYRFASYRQNLNRHDRRGYSKNENIIYTVAYCFLDFFSPFLFLKFEKNHKKIYNNI